jgi:hypothetical protein
VWRRELPTAADKLNVELMVEGTGIPIEIETAVERAARNATDAMIVFDDALFYAEAPRLGKPRN